MAVVWQTSKQGVNYQVRRAGNSVRLYTGGVFHSQWNASRPLAGHLWDVLFLPVLFCPNAPRLDRVLVLGVGGGAVINALNHLLTVKHITGVDFDPLHLRIAKKHFLQNPKNVRLVECDAQAFVVRDTKATYDFIIEDLFCGAPDDSSEAIRPIAVDVEWLQALNEKLIAQGVLAINFEDEAQMRSALRPKVYKAAGFQNRAFFRHPRYENVIAVLFKGEWKNTERFSENLQSLCAAFPAAATRDLRYQLINT